MIDFIDKTSEQNGTPINRNKLMAVQGMENNNVIVVDNADGSVTITDTNSDNQTLTINIIDNDDGSTTIVEVFVGEKTITKTTTINAEGTQMNGVVS